ncbi:MarR family winged helix-turn-helix transcriptional regulator [Pectinatus brassicae]|nr:MarR family winged helix-turn-helix transcriptional regulator [Pectinatus brassicae]
MKLEWMNKHRELVEKIIKYANAYAHIYNKQMDYHAGVDFSAAQIQVLEYVLENEDQKMSEIAKRLGITRSAFSKNVKKLMDKGLLEKFRCNNNQKDIFLKVTPLGEAVYEQYSKFIYETCFKEMFEIAGQIPQKYVVMMERMMDVFADRTIDLGNKGEKQIYTKIHQP